MIDVPVRVKDALREGNLKKNYRLVVYKADGETVDFTIENDRLVAESVSIDERMSSDEKLKFGLCEGTKLEFQAFNIPNITGRRVQAFIDVQYNDDGALAWHSIPLGWYDVKETSRQASTGILKITAYNKLMSDYLDAKANDLIISAVGEGITGRTGSAALSTILDDLLGDYAIERNYKQTQINFISPAERAYGYYMLENGKAVGFLYASCRLHASNFSSDKIYRLVMNCKKIYEKIVSYVPEELYTQQVYDIVYDSGWRHINKGLLSQKLSGEDAHSTDIRVSFRTTETGRIDIKINGENRTKELVDTGWFTNVTSDWTPSQNELANLWNFPVYWKVVDWGGQVGDPRMNWTDEEREIARSRITDLVNDIEYFYYQEQIQSALESNIFTVEQVEQWSDVTLRDLQTAVFEANCRYGKLDRVTDLFSGVELNSSRLYPADDLYPDDSLYPASMSERGNKAMYSKLWADEGNVRKFRYLIITYKTTETEGGQTSEVEKTLQRTVDANGTDDYNMSDNWLFRNLIWTPEQVGAYADEMVAKMRDITWFPFEMWCAGLPYIETGDEIEINMDDGAYTSYVLRRTLKGIQNLQDEMINGTLDIF